MRLHTFPPYSGNPRSPMTVKAPDWYGDARMMVLGRLVGLFDAMPVTAVFA